MWIPVQGVTLIQHVRTPVSQLLLPPRTDDYLSLTVKKKKRKQIGSFRSVNSRQTDDK
jgi:hypothetical protein